MAWNKLKLHPVRTKHVRKLEKREKQYFPMIDKIFDKIFGSEQSYGCYCNRAKDGTDMCETCWTFGKAKYAVFQYIIEDNLKTVFHIYIKQLSKRERDSYRRMIFLEDMRQSGFSDLHTMTVLNEIYLLEDKMKKQKRRKKCQKKSNKQL